MRGFTMVAACQGSLGLAIYSQPASKKRTQRSLAERLLARFFSESQIQGT